MTREEAIKMQKWLGNNHFLFAKTFEDVKASTDMAIKSLEAWEKVKEELKESSYERYFEFGEYIGEDTQKVRIISFDTAMSIIDKHLAEVTK